MLNPIKRIVQFNSDAGLLGKGYDDFLESSFQIEEALEGFPLVNLQGLANQLGMHSIQTISGNIVEPATPKSLSRFIMLVAQGHSGSPYSELSELSDVDRLDKACDSVVYAIGSMAKLGLSAQEITQALNIVMDKNLEKLKNKSYDAEGKLLKDPSFVGPEAQLQLLLDKRK